MQQTLFGFPVLENRWLPEDIVFITKEPALYSSDIVVVGTRPLTEVEIAGRWARWFVRKSLSDRGIPIAGAVGREPKVGDMSVLARMRAEFVAAEPTPLVGLLVDKLADRRHGAAAW